MRLSILLILMIIFFILPVKIRNSVINGSFRVPASVHSATCDDLFFKFMKKGEKVDVFREFYLEKVDILASRLNLETTMREEFIHGFHSLDINPRQLDMISGMIDELFLYDSRHLDQLSSFISFVRYTSTFSPKKQFNLLQSGMEFFHGRDIGNGYVKKFFKIQKKLDKYKMKNIGKGETAAHQMRRRRENLIYSCRSSKMTPELERTNKLFQRFISGIVIGSSSYAYWDKHKNEKKDFLWGKKFMYEVGMNYLGGRALSKILSNPSSKFTIRYLQLYGATGVLNAIDSTVYELTFGVTEEDARKRIDQILKDPQFKERLIQLLQIVKENEIDQELISKFKSNLEKFDGNEGISLADMGDQEIRDMLVEAAKIQVYQDVQGDGIQRGSKGEDRFVFNRMYWVFGAAKNIIIGEFIKNMMCMMKDSPKRALTLAVAIFSVQQILSDDQYFDYKKKLINQ